MGKTLAKTGSPAGALTTKPHVGEFRRVVKVMLARKVVLFGLFVILLTVIAAIFAPVLAPYDPVDVNIREALLQPSRAHLLGTDALGRDTLSRIIYGTRSALIVALVAVMISATVGMILGLLAGYLGGITNAVIMRSVDTLMAFPGIILALTIASLMGGGLTSVILAVGVGLMAMYARVMWGQVITVKETDYVLAERAQGATSMRIMIRHILPNCFPILIVMVTMQMGAAILMEAGLSFLGAGITPPTPAWGSMISDGYLYLTTYPLLSIAPGVAIMLLVFSFNMVGDGLRDALDPRLRGVL